MEDFRKKLVWLGSYKGCGFEICQHSISKEYNPNGIWCSYLWLNSLSNPEILDFSIVSRMSEPTISGRTYEITEPDDFLNNLPWNGGQTFCEVYSTPMGTKTIKIGDDYAHSWDDSHRLYYDENILFNRIKHVIDEYRNKYPEKVE